ncbi:MAG: MBL fold metallo-hydrolase [Rhodospirillaceae bacterium]|nr:MBL fold metallo-hydrolase [Rhodospirillaceae bacterium]
MKRLQVEAFFDKDSFTVTYVAADQDTKACAIIDPVLDFDPASGRTGHASADAVIAYIRNAGLTLDWILETHAHADHLSAAAYIKAALGGHTGIGEHIVEVQKIFGRVFNFKDDFSPDGRQFDRLFADGDTFAVGSLLCRVMHTPGHTPACVTYVIGDASFVGDTLFMPDYGSARADFPGGDARTLYRSMRRILELPDETRLFTCHDYGTPSRPAFAWESTVAQQRRGNIHVRDGIGEEAFVEMRTARDRTLDMPRLILPSIQVNIRAGAMPPAEDNGVSYLKLPINAL